MPYNDLITRTDAQAMIPEQVSDAMLTSLRDTSAVLQLATRIPVATNQTRFPVLSALPSAYWVNGDTGLKQTSDAAWANKFINIEELAVIVPIPENVLDDAGFDVWASVRPLMESAIARQLDSTIFFGGNYDQGTGAFTANAPASFPTNVVAGAVAAGNTATAGATTAANGGLAQDFSDLFATVEGDGYDVTGVVANTQMKGRLRSVRSTDGSPLNGQVTQGEVFGEPVTYPMRGLWRPLVAATVRTLAIAGDFSNMVVGVRRDFTYKLLTEGVITDAGGLIQFNLPQQDMVALRLTFRVGWQVANPINYDRAVEASRYPFGVLQSASGA